MYRPPSKRLRCKVFDPEKTALEMSEPAHSQLLEPKIPLPVPLDSKYKSSSEPIAGTHTLSLHERRCRKLESKHSSGMTRVSSLLALDSLVAKTMTAAGDST